MTPKQPRKKQVKRIKAWVAFCSVESDGNVGRAFRSKHHAERHAEFLNGEFSGRCTHKIIRAVISFTLPRPKVK